MLNTQIDLKPYTDNFHNDTTDKEYTSICFTSIGTDDQYACAKTGNHGKENVYLDLKNVPCQNLPGPKCFPNANK